jgi:hypothetical protein
LDKSKAAYKSPTKLEPDKPALKLLKGENNMGWFTTTKQAEPKKPVVSAQGVAFRLHQPSGNANVKPTGKEGIWKYEPRS